MQEQVNAKLVTQVRPSLPRVGEMSAYLLDDNSHRKNEGPLDFEEAFQASLINGRSKHKDRKVCDIEVRWA